MFSGDRPYLLCPPISEKKIQFQPQITRGQADFSKQICEIHGNARLVYGFE